VGAQVRTKDVLAEMEVAELERQVLQADDDADSDGQGDGGGGPDLSQSILEALVALQESTAQLKAQVADLQQHMQPKP
jgi:hypothetical protein